MSKGDKKRIKVEKCLRRYLEWAEVLETYYDEYTDKEVNNQWKSKWERAKANLELRLGIFIYLSYALRALTGYL